MQSLGCEVAALNTVQFSRFLCILFPSSLVGCKKKGASQRQKDDVRGNPAVARDVVVC